MTEPLSVRRELLRTEILPKLGEPIRHCPELNTSLADVIASVRAAGLEGLVGQAIGRGIHANRFSSPRVVARFWITPIVVTTRK
jgi:hypothetical protein